MDVADLVDRTYGPRPLRVSIDSVADFIAVTGDDSAPWTDFAPPGYAAAALFVVAPELLGMLSDRSVIHGEQSFSWEHPIGTGSLLEVRGTVTRARERGGVHFVGFEMEARDQDVVVLTGSSLFVVSGEAIPGAAEFERPEPPHSYRGTVEPGQVSASRADLVRYAAATRDWNPVHWDHDAAVTAGFPGVLVHGLLQASWAFIAAAKSSVSARPLASARVRFRNPLLPARPVNINADREGDIVNVIISDDEADYITARIELVSE